MASVNGGDSANIIYRGFWERGFSYVLHFGNDPKNYADGFALYRVLLWFSTGRFYLYPSGLIRWHWGNHKIAPVSVKQPWKDMG